MESQAEPADSGPGSPEGSAGPSRKRRSVWSGLMPGCSAPGMYSEAGACPCLPGPSYDRTGRAPDVAWPVFAEVKDRIATSRLKKKGGFPICGVPQHLGRQHKLTPVSASRLCCQSRALQLLQCVQPDVFGSADVVSWVRDRLDRIYSNNQVELSWRPEGAKHAVKRKVNVVHLAMQLAMHRKEVRANLLSMCM